MATKITTSALLILMLSVVSAYDNCWDVSKQWSSGNTHGFNLNPDQTCEIVVKSPRDGQKRSTGQIMFSSPVQAQRIECLPTCTSSQLVTNGVTYTAQGTGSSVSQITFIMSNPNSGGQVRSFSA